MFFPNARVIHSPSSSGDAFDPPLAQPLQGTQNDLPAGFLFAPIVMSSQSDSGIPLLHAPSGVGYRLIELPAELVSLMESDNPPVYV